MNNLNLSGNAYPQYVLQTSQPQSSYTTILNPASFTALQSASSQPPSSVQPGIALNSQFTTTSNSNSTSSATPAFHQHQQQQQPGIYALDSSSQPILIRPEQLYQVQQLQSLQPFTTTTMVQPQTFNVLQTYPTFVNTPNGIQAIQQLHTVNVSNSSSAATLNNHHTSNNIAIGNVQPQQQQQTNTNTNTGNLTMPSIPSTITSLSCLQQQQPPKHEMATSIQSSASPQSIPSSSCSPTLIPMTFHSSSTTPPPQQLLQLQLQPPAAAASSATSPQHNAPTVLKISPTESVVLNSNSMSSSASTTSSIGSVPSALPKLFASMAETKPPASNNSTQTQSTISMEEAPAVFIKQDHSENNNHNEADRETRIISFAPNNNGQIVITKRENMSMNNPLKFNLSTTTTSSSSPILQALPSAPHAALTVGALNAHNLAQTHQENASYLPFTFIQNVQSMQSGNSSSSSDNEMDDDKKSIHSNSSASTMLTAGDGEDIHSRFRMTYTCDQCGKSFKHKSNLKIHLIIHTEDALCCDFCGKKFARKSNLTQHLRVHTGERPYSCEFCGRKFKQSHSLKDHVRIHTGEKPYECEFCAGEKPFICRLCLKKFASKSSLNGHTKKVHPGQWWLLHPEAKKYTAMLSKRDQPDHEEQEAAEQETQVAPEATIAGVISEQATAAPVAH